MAVYRAIDLCSGIGGAALGYHAAGFLTFGADINPKAVAMANANGLCSTQMDLFAEDAVERLRHVYAEDAFESLRQAKGADLVHASPSCRGYSQASNATPEHKARECALTTRVAEVISELAPPVWVIENVLHARHHPTFVAAIETLQNAGYHVVTVSPTRRRSQRRGAHNRDDACS